MSCASNQKFPWEVKQTSQPSYHSSEHSGISPLGIPVYELYEEPGLFTVRSNFSPLMVLPSLILHLGSEWFCYFHKTQPEKETTIQRMWKRISHIPKTIPPSTPESWIKDEHPSWQ